ncbi:hypothetical protein [Methylobacterium hispanicum]|uniref:hypothetical protein n=1 Tax=Methylobacterium hispanicum TaxID=270350 RepID=UPI002F2D75F3
MPTQAFRLTLVLLAAAGLASCQSGASAPPPVAAAVAPVAAPAGRLAGSRRRSAGGDRSEGGNAGRQTRPVGVGSGRPGPDRGTRSASGERRGGEELRARQERLLDEAIEETFPASDPIAPKRITR